MSCYTCANCGGGSGMYGHYNPSTQKFTCSKKGEKTVTITQRSEEAKEAYAQGYMAALKLAIDKCKNVSTSTSVEHSLSHILEGFLAARGESE